MVIALDAVTVIHNAFRRDMAEIGAAAYQIDAQGGDLTTVLDRLQVFNKVLLAHAADEEDVVFPAMEKAAPQVAAPYLIDHRELDTMTAGLDAVLRSPSELDAARATAVLTSHLRIHLHKGDTHLYPILRRTWSPDEQAVIVGHMSKVILPEFMSSLVHWMFPLVSQDNQAIMANVWAALMPPEVFENIKPLIRDAVTAADLAQLMQRVPPVGVKTCPWMV